MPRILIIVQEVGGVGKTTLARGVAEAVPDAPIIEIESTQRILEYDHGRSKRPPRVTHFAVRADRTAIEASGGQAARAEFDSVINAIVGASLPTIVDVGANAALSLLGTFDVEFTRGLSDTGIELGLLVVVTADPSALSQGAKLLAMGKWAKARFVVENRLRGEPDPALLKRVCLDAVVTTLAKRDFEPRTMRFIQAMGLSAVPSLKTADLQREHGFAQAHRMVADLKAFRLAVMESVRPAATWLAS